MSDLMRHLERFEPLFTLAREQEHHPPREEFMHVARQAAAEDRWAPFRNQGGPKIVRLDARVVLPDVHGVDVVTYGVVQDSCGQSRHFVARIIQDRCELSRGGTGEVGEGGGRRQVVVDKFKHQRPFGPAQLEALAANEEDVAWHARQLLLDAAQHLHHIFSQTRENHIKSPPIPDGPQPPCNLLDK